MSELEQLYMWALRLGGLGLALRWRTQALALAVALVVWTAVGPRAALIVFAVGVVGPLLRRLRRDGVQLGR